MTFTVPKFSLPLFCFGGFMQECMVKSAHMCCSSTEEYCKAPTAHLLLSTSMRFTHIPFYVVDLNLRLFNFHHIVGTHYSWLHSLSLIEGVNRLHTPSGEALSVVAAGIFAFTIVLWCQQLVVYHVKGHLDLSIRSTDDLLSSCLCKLYPLSFTIFILVFFKPDLIVWPRLSLNWTAGVAGMCYHTLPLTHCEKTNLQGKILFISTLPPPLATPWVYHSIFFWAGGMCWELCWEWVVFRFFSVWFVSYLF